MGQKVFNSRQLRKPYHFSGEFLLARLAKIQRAARGSWYFRTAPVYVLRVLFQDSGRRSETGECLMHSQILLPLSLHCTGFSLLITALVAFLSLLIRFTSKIATLLLPAVFLLLSKCFLHKATQVCPSSIPLLCVAATALLGNPTLADLFSRKVIQKLSEKT